MIGIHCPEFEFEKDRGRVERFARQFKMSNPIYIDDDFAYWKALQNKFWPEFYLVDRQGIIQGRILGEMHDETERAKRFEYVLKELLKEEYPAATK